MAKVTNNTSRGVSFRGWRVLPNSGKIVDRMGHVRDTMPDHDAYCPLAKRLADDGILTLEGYTPRSKIKKVAIVAPTKDPDPEANKAADTVEEKTPKKKPGKK